MTSTAVEGEPSKKKSQRKKSEPKEEGLTLAKAVQLSHATVAKYSPKDLQQVKELYEKEFGGLHIFGRRPYKVDNDGPDMIVDISHLHRAPDGVVVYRPLDQHRVTQLINQKRTMPSFQALLQHVYVMPLRGPPRRTRDSDVPVAEYFLEPPKRKDINANTHFYIIGGQHSVAAHKFLIEEGILSPSDAKDASSSCITIVWAKPEKFSTLIYYSRVLNQDLAGNRTEGNFLSQLETARKSWVDAGRPKPSIRGGQNTAQFKVSLLSSLQ